MPGPIKGRSQRASRTDVVVDAQRFAREHAAEAMDVLRQIMRGDPKAGSKTVVTFPDGKQQVTETPPGPKDRAAAAQALLRYAGVERAAEGAGGGGVNPADLLRAMLAALSDPAVRRWLETEQPDTLQALRLLAAKPAEIISAEDTASVVPTSDSANPDITAS